jgi:hypothetical protein
MNIDWQELLERNKDARLWSKDVWNDICCSKWADLWPEDVFIMLELVKQLNTQPKTAEDYRQWLKN